jgi:hypothetical protein
MVACTTGAKKANVTTARTDRTHDQLPALPLFFFFISSITVVKNIKCCFCFSLFCFFISAIVNAALYSLFLFLRQTFSGLCHFGHKKWEVFFSKGLDFIDIEGSQQSP